MAPPDGQRPDDPALIKQATDWFTRMRGDGADSARPEFERWRASDPRHREVYARISREFEVTGLLRTSHYYREHQAVRAKPKMFPRPGLVAAGAFALVLAVVSGVMFVPGLYMPSGTVHAATRIETAIGEIKRATLSDGSVVTLDTDSRVELVHAGDTQILHILRGRARVEQAREDRRDPVVEANGLTVTGRRFDVSVDARWARVICLAGDVGVRNGAVSTTDPVHIHDGQLLQSVPGMAAQSVGPAPKGALEWVRGMLSFDGVPLADVIVQTNRYSKAKLRLADAATGALKVTGAFRPLPVNDLAAALAAAFNLRIERAGNGDIILHVR